MAINIQPEDSVPILWPTENRLFSAIYLTLGGLVDITPSTQKHQTDIQFGQVNNDWNSYQL